MARSVDFGNHTDGSSASISNNTLDICGAVLLPGRVCVFHHLRVGTQLDCPALTVNQMPMKNVQLGQGHAIELFVYFLDAEEVSTRVEHDAPVAIVGLIHDDDRLFDDKSSFTVGDDQLLQRCQSVNGTPNCSSIDRDGRRGNIETVRLVHIKLQVGCIVIDTDSDL